MHDGNKTNVVWQKKLDQCLNAHDYAVSPRGMGVWERVGDGYRVTMPAFIDLVDRNVNVNFMFAEAAWILSGSNRLMGIYPHMKAYAKFSDDGVFLRGAYGPKVVDQLGYVVDVIAGDVDTRQAVINIWRERPGPSKDIPCTLSMQFLVREGALHAVVTMRSQDIVLGFTYDVFTFSMVARAVQLLLRERGVDVQLGELYVRAGSLHLYENHIEKAANWVGSKDRDFEVVKAVGNVLTADTYTELISALWEGARRYGESR